MAPFDQGQLLKDDDGRWELNGITLTSGAHFEIRIQGHWIRVVIEHDGLEYQAYPQSIRLCRGLEARFISDYTD